MIMKEMKEEHIELLQEEQNNLDNMKEVCIYENEKKGIKIFIRLADVIYNVNRKDILDRYNNDEYWNFRLDRDNGEYVRID